jgi:radical SAM superfamily enzyme YgiQ (UPF0313 family)
MKLLLLRPVPPNERFGLGPFFRIEPLGLQYIAAAVRAAGHEVAIYDLRFVRDLRRVLQRERPRLVGIASAHTLDTNAALEVARAVKGWAPEAFTLVGGHSAAVFPYPFDDPAVDAICVEDGESVVPELVQVLEKGGDWRAVAGVVSRPHAGGLVFGPSSPDRVSLDAVPLPARDALKSGHRHYLCVQRRPVYLVETARGCPYRCSFCTIWQHVDRTVRFRDIGTVVQDFQSVGDSIFIADDLFWYPEERSRELAVALKKAGVKKSWLLVQSRTDLVARHEELLAEWRGVAEQIDIFFGFESPTDRGLDALSKDSGVEEISAAVQVCRRLGYGITGNFIVDLDWEEADFEELWQFTSGLGLDHLGYTLLTPLPGTQYFEDERPRIRELNWSNYDMHHILWEPKLGRQRFYELFAETWKRSALNAKGAGSWWSYLKQVRPQQIPFLLKVLRQSRRLFDPQAYLRECFEVNAKQAPAATPHCSAGAGDTKKLSLRGP